MPVFLGGNVDTLRRILLHSGVFRHSRFRRVVALMVVAIIACQAHSQEKHPGVTDPSLRVVERSGAEVGPSPLILIGFMGGRVSPDNFVHKEALLAKDLQQRFPLAVHAAVFANRDGDAAFRAVLHLLGASESDGLSANQKRSARIVIFGHSWGASETVNLARRLDELKIPVLLTVQVDSVQKLNENDERIPPNVREAINFYQSEGFLHGRSLIRAMDPGQTKILGNYESTYRVSPVSCTGYPWYARAFMKPHIEIENDPNVWDRIEGLIRTKIQ